MWGKTSKTFFLRLDNDAQTQHSILPNVESVNASRVLCDEESREGEEGRRWRQLEGGEHGEHRCAGLTDEGLSIVAFLSPAGLRLEAGGSGGGASRMENQDQFLCGVVEGKSGRPQTSCLTAQLCFPLPPRSWMAHCLTQIRALFTCSSCCRWSRGGRVLTGAWIPDIGGVLMLVSQQSRPKRWWW